MLLCINTARDIPATMAALHVPVPLYDSPGVVVLYVISFDPQSVHRVDGFSLPIL